MANMRGRQVARVVARVIWVHRDDDDALCKLYFAKLMRHIEAEMMLYERSISTETQTQKAPSVRNNYSRR